MMQLAELNVAQLKHDMDDPRVADFMDNIDRVNGIAERAPGFVWRSAEDDLSAPPATARAISTLSVWQNVSALENFVWDTVHRQFFQRRAEWFDALEQMHFVMWWVPNGTQPTMADAHARLAHLNIHGNTDHAFGWDHLPDATRWRDMQSSAATE